MAISPIDQAASSGVAEVDGTRSAGELGGSSSNGGVAAPNHEAYELESLPISGDTVHGPFHAPLHAPLHVE